VVDHGFEPWSCQTKDYNTDISCFSATLCIDGHFSTNINKINNYLSPQIIEHKKKKMQTDLAWDRHKNVDVLNEFKSLRHLI
jgi:hypothetical protein